MPTNQTTAQTIPIWVCKYKRKL